MKIRNYILLLVCCLPFVLSSKHDINKICNGFELITPEGGQPSMDVPPTTTYTIGENLTVQWKLGNSLVTKFVAIELFSFTGLIEYMWIGKIPAEEGSKNITLNVRPTVAIPGIYFLRVWGESSNGPACITYSKTFRLVPYHVHDQIFMNLPLQ
ncbi:hypothetical protein K450DRAFT_262158 [Umbelopsis ramanniana AG]|uniref:Uncharacterized protein n=1 Tax=Umbelopsis ramanniana AG TaxID=1314678 RepID=A0AAD5DZV4_UMBRA|nr:uncharacterized protein K450DRAFT_262158 [Umbelopsis ramanniana AG]KAI8575383.1 hypothetical protein K450DRAFT_262158 [Umbelopsis ramanniana AG]